MSFRGNRDDTIPYAASAESPVIKAKVATGEAGVRPPNGTAVSADGFYYVVEREVMAVWAKAGHCLNPAGIPFDPYGVGVWGKPIGLNCTVYGPCAEGTGLVSCLFRGKHHMPWNDCEGKGGCLDPQSWKNHTTAQENRVFAHNVFNRVAFNFMLAHPKLNLASD